MEVEPGEGWADALSKVLRMGTKNPTSNQILRKAKLEKHEDESDSDESVDKPDKPSKGATCLTKWLKPDPQADALMDNQLKNDATRGVVHLFNAVKTVNPKSDKKKNNMKKKKKKKKKPITKRPKKSQRRSNNIR